MVFTALVLQQFLMGASFQDTATFHDDNFVGVLNGGQEVGDDDGSSVFHELHEGVLH